MIHACYTCDGTGWVGTHRKDGTPETEVCPTCGGAGKFHLDGP